MFATPYIYVGLPIGATKEVQCQVARVVIHHGRDDPTTQPLASTATIDFVGPLPASVVIGESVEIYGRMTTGGQYQRFAGEVTDIGVSWETVDRPRPQVIATGKLGRIGRRVIGDTPWPAELDGDRVNRILGLAGFPPQPGFSDRGTLFVLPRDVDAQPALDLAHGTASDGGGIVWQGVNGAPSYADALHRRGAALAYEFNACDLSLGLTWLQGLEGVANDVRVRYGDAGAGLQPEVQSTNPASIAERGTYAASISTEIRDQVDARKRADEIIARQADPAWVLGGIEVDLGLLAEPDTREVFGLEMHDLASVTGLPAGSPATSARVWVEGWRETIEAPAPGRLAWSIAYATSDYCRTAAPPLWDDVPPDVTWATIDPGRTWDSVVCLPPAPSQGRWNDVPASLRWSGIMPQSTTWDDWPY